jgi:hypothetical protein
MLLVVTYTNVREIPRARAKAQKRERKGQKENSGNNTKKKGGGGQN